MIVIVIVVPERRTMRPKEEQKSEPFLSNDFEVPLYTIYRGVIQPWLDPWADHDEFGFVQSTNGS